MSKIYIFYLFIGFFLQSLPSLAQNDPYNFAKISTYNGLSHNQVNTIFKDSDGFLWFGTMSGLNRYDGYTFKTYYKKINNKNSLPDNYILSLSELPNQKMHVTTKGGACIYDANTDKFDTDWNLYLYSLGLPQGWINNIVKGNKGRYWFLYERDGLYVYSSNNKTTKLFKHRPNPNLKLTALQETLDGKLWLIYENGFLQKYDIQSDKIILSSNAIQKFNNNDTDYRLLIDRDSDIWVWSFLYGVFLFHPSNQSVKQINETSYPTQLSTNKVTQVVEDNNGLVWIATDQGGVTLINKKKNQTSYLLNDLKDSKSISQNVIYTMYKDNYGILWLGTHKQGINYLNNNIVQFSRYQHRDSNANSLQYDDVNDFVEDKRGNLWIGTNGGGLIYFDRKKNVFKQYLHNPHDKTSLSDNVVVSLCIDHEEKLWIGTYFGGLSKFDGKKFMNYKHDNNDPTSLVNDNVWKIYEDKEHNLWVGTLGGGLDKFNRKTNAFKHLQINAISNYISTILQDKYSNVWIGADNGVTVLKKNGEVVSYRHTNEKNSLSHNNVTCILKDNKDRIWIGTRDGLNLFNEKSQNFETFTTSNGLPDNLILSILEDNYGTFWLSTPNGLCNAVLIEKKNSFIFSIKNYDESNNLQSLNFNDHAALKTKAGELIFGGSFGFNIINPQIIKKVNISPKISFTNLQILNKNIEPGEEFNNRVVLEKALTKLQQIDLKYSENVFSIEFVSLDFIHSPHVKYAYMLEGFNQGWFYVDNNQRRATYTNLTPGKYTLKVKVLGNNQKWSEVKSLQINIAPPLWRSTIAYIVYCIFFLMLFYFIRRITLERIFMRFEVQQQRKEVERVQALEQLKTRLFTNVSHEFRTPLSLIITPLEKIIKETTEEDIKKQLNLIQRNANRLLNLVNQLLDFRKMESHEIKLHPSIGDIVGFVRERFYLFADIAEKKHIQFSFSSNIDTLEIYFDKDKIEKIFFNLLSNAFKYSYDYGSVSINLTYNQLSINENTITIEVKDTGIGIVAEMQEKIFEHFFQTDVPEGMLNQGTGLGLAITKEFVRLHDGTITVKSEPEKGSCFTVILPTKKIYEVSSQIINNVTLVSNPPIEIAEEISNNTKKKKKKTILLVEDSDELRFYLKDNLKELYKIEEAINGKEGWEKTKKIMPDIVVSDIMMPLMNGIEMSKKIKNETLTAHIPIILLTAMGSEQQQIEGFKIGVNDYISKPFTFEILVSRIKNLLTQQELLQKKFQKQLDINLEEVTITSLDEKFLDQALKAVERNMGNTDFTVENLSSDMNMNRVTLYRKILSLTGKTPLEFIRLVRLKKAAQLLEKSGMSVAEIAYEVGFNNPKNFTAFFKEEFQILPSKYREQTHLAKSLE